MKTEAELQTWFTRGEWWDELGDTYQYELKFAVGDRLGYSNILKSEHQIKALLDGKSAVGKMHKISDADFGYKPCDGYAIRKAGGWYVFGFNGGEEVYAVDVDRVYEAVYEKDPDGGILGRKRGSFTLGWAQEFGLPLRSSQLGR